MNDFFCSFLNTLHGDIMDSLGTTSSTRLPFTPEAMLECQTVNRCKQASWIWKERKISCYLARHKIQYLPDVVARRLTTLLQLNIACVTNWWRQHQPWRMKATLDGIPRLVQNWIITKQFNMNIIRDMTDASIPKRKMTLTQKFCSSPVLHTKKKRWPRRNMFISKFNSGQVLTQSDIFVNNL